MTTHDALVNAGLELSHWCRQYPDTLRGWIVVIDARPSKRYGQCRSRVREIGLSKKYVELNTWEVVRQTVLHEIAHALAGAGNGHNRVWKRWCGVVGCPPNRCSDERNRPGLVRVPPKFLSVCKHCKKVTGWYHRKPRAIAACGFCCKEFNHGRFDWRFQVLYMRVEELGNGAEVGA